MNKTTLTTLKQRKEKGEKFATITAYDATFSRLAENAGIEVILVGDSLGNVMQGQKSTVPVSMDEMCYHTQCVERGLANSLLMTDMPFMSYANPDQTIINAAELMQSGAQMVKIEGSSWLEDSVYMMSQRGIPVCAHLGLLPQSVAKQGGYRMQGKDEASANQILEDAKNLEEAGSDMILLECVPAALAKQITESVKVPVIGIGAGPDTNSQVLVCYDALGLSARLPSFSKNYMKQADSIQQALSAYADEVKESIFPGDQYTIA